MICVSLSPRVIYYTLVEPGGLTRVALSLLHRAMERLST